MINFQELAAEVFSTVKTYDSDIILYDANGNRVFDAQDSSRIFSQGLNILITINDEGENSNIVLNCTDSNQVDKLHRLITTLRSISNNSNIMFSLKLLGDKVTPNKLAPVTESLLEGMYGTSSSSYIKLEGAKVIVRHSKPINSGLVGARGRNIKEIFVEDSTGTRIEFKPRLLLGARALATHLNNGGNFADAVSNQITRMASDYVNLQTGITQLSTSPESTLPNGTHVSVAMHEGAVGIRKTLVDLSSQGKYQEAISGLGSLVESSENTENVVEFIKIKMDEQILDSIKRNTTVKVTEKNAYGDYNKDRDIVDPDGSHDGDADGDADGLSESLMESIREFDTWLDDATQLAPTQEVPVEVEQPEPAVPHVEQEPVVVAEVDEEHAAIVAKVAAIDMAQDALRDVLKQNAKKFVDMPAHTVVRQHIIPSIVDAVEQRKLAYDALVDAVNTAASGGDLGELMKLLDIAAVIEGYEDFSDFTFSAAVGDVLVDELQAQPEQTVEPEAQEVDEVEPEVSQEPEVEQAENIPEVITKTVVTEIERSVGVVTPKMTKIEFNSYGEWKKAKESVAEDSLKFSATAMVEGESKLVAKWDVVNESGWVMLPELIEEESSDDDLYEELTSVIVSGTYDGVNHEALRDTNAYVNNRDFYKAVLNATRGYGSSLEEYLDVAARKLGSPTFKDYRTAAEQYRDSLGAKEVNNVIVGAFK